MCHFASQLMKSDVTVLGRREGRPRQSRQAVMFNVDFRHSPTEVIDTVESALRPTGIARIDGRRVDVVTRGEQLEPGTRVRVVEVSGNRLVVAAVEAPVDPQQPKENA